MTREGPPATGRRPDDEYPSESNWMAYATTHWHGTATQAGRCAGCGADVAKGDPIVPDPGGDGWLCQECS